MKNGFILSLIFLSLVLNSSAYAENYACGVVLFRDNGTSKEWQFEPNPNPNDGHGGQEYQFSDENDSISILANKQWLGISWSINQVKVAQTVFVIGSADSTNNRVAIVYDPNSEAQVSLSCDLMP